MRKSIRSLLPLSVFAATMVFASCNGGDCINGSGNQVSQNRSVEPFSAVETGGSLKLVLQQSTKPQVRVLADDNVQQYIKTRVSGDRLNIELDGNSCNTGPITVYVASNTFSGVDASGSVEIVSEGKINTNDFNLGLSGNSKVNLDVNAANFVTRASGSSEITLRGQAGSHQLELSGAGEVDAFDFVVGNYKIETSGSSRSNINVLNTLDVETSGASEIQYRGNPKNVNNSQSGAGSLKKVN